MKVGDYVRTNKGNVAKIVKITDLTIICDHIIYPINYYGFNKQLRKESLKRLGVKSSPNIIDLIEVGDYVNGHKVFDKAPGCVYIENIENKINHIPITRDNLESVLSKELFESMNYKIGE